MDKLWGILKDIVVLEHECVRDLKNNNKGEQKEKQGKDQKKSFERKQRDEIVNAEKKGIDSYNLRTMRVSLCSNYRLLLLNRHQ